MPASRSRLPVTVRSGPAPEPGPGTGGPGPRPGARLRACGPGSPQPVPRMSPSHCAGSLSISNLKVLKSQWGVHTFACFDVT